MEAGHILDGAFWFLTPGYTTKVTALPWSQQGSSG